MADKIILNSSLATFTNELELYLSETACTIDASAELVHASRDLDRFSEGEGQQPPLIGALNHADMTGAW